MRKGKNWWMDEPGYVKYLPLVRDTSIPIKNVIPGVLKWLHKPKYDTYEPYGALMRDMFCAGKNGSKSKVGDWGELLLRAEAIVRSANKRGSFFAQAILNECIAHRYADCLFQTRNLEWEEKMRSSYVKAYKAAVKGKYWKNVDSSLYWLAFAYHNASKKNRFPEDKERFLKLSYEYYSKVVNRKGTRYKQSSAFNEKMRMAKRMYNKLGLVCG